MRSLEGADWPPEPAQEPARSSGEENLVFRQEFSTPARRTGHFHDKQVKYFPFPGKPGSSSDDPGSFLGSPQSGGTAGGRIRMNDAARRRAFGRAGWLAWFSLVALLLWLVHLDRRPQPIFADQFTHPDAAAVFVTALLPLEVSLHLPMRPSSVRVPVRVEAGQRPLELKLRITGPDGEVTESFTRIDESGLMLARVPPGPASGVDLRFSITSDARSREQAPSVLWAREPPRIPLDVRYAGKPLDAVSVLPPTGPLFLLEYVWPTRWLLALWCLVIAFAPLLRRADPRLGSAWLAGLALVATLTSAFLWQRDYTRRAAHVDADRYTESAERMAEYIVDPVARGQLSEWFREYPHASTQAVPALLVPLIVIGWPASFTYALASALATWLAWLSFRRIAVVHFGITDSHALLMTAAFACHPLMLRSVARPVTDSIGLLLVLLTLGLLLRRMRSLERRDELLLSVLVLLHPLVRPQGFGYWPFIALALVWADCIREGGWPGLARVAIRGLRVFAVPLVVLAVSYGWFGWSHNVELMLAKARRFRIDSTPGDFVASLLGVVQALPLLGLLARRPGSPRLRSDSRIQLVVAWALYAVVLLIAVRAPFWLRHFLPVLPVAFWLAGRWLTDLRGAREVLAIGLVTGLACANVAITLWQIFRLESLPPWLAALTSVP